VTEKKGGTKYDDKVLAKQNKFTKAADDRDKEQALARMNPELAPPNVRNPKLAMAMYAAAAMPNELETAAANRGRDRSLSSV
jgi:hypothetical protein